MPFRSGKVLATMTTSTTRFVWPRSTSRHLIDNGLSVVLVTCNDGRHWLRQVTGACMRNCCSAILHKKEEAVSHARSGSLIVGIQEENCNEVPARFAGCLLAGHSDPGCGGAAEGLGAGTDVKLASHNAVIEGNAYRVRYEQDIQDAAGCRRRRRMVPRLLRIFCLELGPCNRVANREQHQRGV